MPARNNRLPTLEAVELFHRGTLALAVVERNGVCVDMDYVNKTHSKITLQIEEIQQKMREDGFYSHLRKRYGEKANMGSRPQLATVLGGLGLIATKEKTATGRDKMDKSALDLVDEPYVRLFLKAENLKKTRGTYLDGLIREVVCNRVHPSYNLNIATTYRSSCQNPNFQNIPARDPVMAGLARPCYIPSPGNQILEVDCAGAEVRVAQCYHKDPTMDRYIRDESTDMHRDMAMQIYFLKREDVDKKMKGKCVWARHAAKNKYVFPVFYGSYYLKTAPALWEEAASNVGPDGRPMIEHLKRNGIKSLGRCVSGESPQPGTFEYHMKKVEDHFWKQRFAVYAQWKKSWHKLYESRGYLTMKTGFCVAGVLNRNDVINYPVQGASFHCLLWSMIQIIDWLRKNKMRTKVVGQIHDSIIFDTHPKEMGDVLRMCNQVMTIDLPKAWKWIIVPLKIEAEAAPIDASWHAKTGVSIT